MRQLTLATGTFETHRKPTRREKFLSDREKVVPWQDLCAVIAPYYPKGENGRPPVGLERMLRIYFLQQWFNLSDPGAEEALYESVSLCRFVGIDLGREPVPDETTILKFRHLLEKHHLGKKLFREVHRHRESQGVKVTQGTIVDATIINAPSSTKNKDKARDLDMHQTKKGNQWFFGMKAHIGVDSKTKVIHAVALPAVWPVATAANVHDATALSDLLHGEETRVWGDSAYQGQTDVLRQHAPEARDLTNRRTRYKGVVNEAERARNRIKSQIRSRVERVFGVIKGVFGFVKVRYRGLEKNAHRLFVTCALANIYLVRRRLLRPLRA